MDETSLRALDRKALQKLAKTNGIKANLKSNEIIKQLIAKQPSKSSGRSARPAISASQARRRSTAQGQPQPNVSATSQPHDNEDAHEPVRGAPSSHIQKTQPPSSQPPPAPPAFGAQYPLPSTSKLRRRATGRTQPQTSKSRSIQPRDSQDGSELARRVSRKQAPPPQPSSPPSPVVSQTRLPSFQQHLSMLEQPQAGPSRTQSKAPTLGVFNEASASRAPWPQEPRNAPHSPLSPPSPSPLPGSSKQISNMPRFPLETHPYSVSTGIPKGVVFPSYHRPMPQTMGNAEQPGTSASASASASRRGQIVPQPGYRSRSPTPLEEYDSLRGVPLFPEPDSDYEESWTPYSSPAKPSNGYPQPAAGPSAQPAGGHPAADSPVFPLTRAVFGPPPRVFAPPPRSPVFRPPSPPPRPTNPVGRDEASPAIVPQAPPAGIAAREEEEGAEIDAEGGEEEYDDEEEEEDEGTAPATDGQLHGMVARMAMIARHQCGSQTHLDEISDEVKRLQGLAPRLRGQMRQERAGFERIRTYLTHLNARLEPEWDHDAIWDEARLLRDDGYGNQVEVETSDEEEAEWKREHPLPPNARATEIQMQRWTPWFPGVCEDEDGDNIRDIAAATEKCRAEYKEIDAIRGRARVVEPSDGGAGPVPSTPKRRRGDEDDGGRVKKKVRGSAGRTPPPKAFFRKGTKKAGGADVKTPPLVGIAEEDSEEENMEMTSVV